MVGRIDYYDIEEELAQILRTDPRTQEAKVLVEEELNISEGDTILIELERRDAPPDLQTASAGLRTRYQIQISVWCYAYAFEKEVSMRRRDDLLGRVELVIQENRGLNGKVGSTWLQGGDFENRRDVAGQGFVAAAQIEVICEATAVST